MKIPSCWRWMSSDAPTQGTIQQRANPTRLGRIRLVQNLNIFNFCSLLQCVRCKALVATNKYVTVYRSDSFVVHLGDECPTLSVICPFIAGVPKLRIPSKICNSATIRSAIWFTCGLATVAPLFACSYE